MDLLNHITVPAPRMLLRVRKLSTLLKNLSLSENDINGCEIGPGFGDVSSLLIGEKIVNSLDVYEASDEARNLLLNRFGNEKKIQVKELFNVTETKYQLIVCCEVIEHIEDDSKFVSQIAESMTEKGVFVGSVPAYQSKWQAVDELAGHYRRYDKQDLIELLSHANFHNIKIISYGFPLINILNPIRSIYYGNKLKKTHTFDKNTATNKSGIKRGFVKNLDKNTVYSIVNLFSKLHSQKLFEKFDDGFIFICEK